MTFDSRNRPADGDGDGAGPVRVAVVGAGYWGPNLIRNLAEFPEAEVRWVCDLREEALTAVKRRHPEIQTSRDFMDAVRDPWVEAVAIATPVSTHYPLAKAALECGKHVLVEKPLAASSTEARELIDLARRHDLLLMPGHTFVYSPPVNTIRDIIDRGELGSIYFISMSRVNLGLHQKDVSVVWDLAPHDFSILLYWLGESPRSVAAMSRGCIIPDIPDVVFVSLEFDSGVVAHLELSWLAPSKLRRTTIVGSEKMVVYDDTSNEPVRVFDSGVALEPPETFGEFRLTYRTGGIVSPPIEAVEPLSVELKDFCRSVRDGSTPRSSAALGLDVIYLLEAVDQSLETGSRATVLAEARSPLA
ncbi:MAG: Gfo/Idh/MocA family protein [Gaiellaceae bacterium]